MEEMENLERVSAINWSDTSSHYVRFVWKRELIGILVDFALKDFLIWIRFSESENMIDIDN